MLPGRRAQAAYRAALTSLAILAAGLAAAAFPAAAAASPAAAARAARTPIVPPANPQYSLAVGRYLPGGCTGILDFSATCMRQSLAMINAGRRAEGLGPVILPANWQGLTMSQQLFVLTELERTARGLPADAGLSTDLNDTAVSGANAGRDPVGTASGFGSLWAGGEPNTIVVMADWIYEDGLFTDGLPPENLTCSASVPGSCWRHRDILLHDGNAGSCGDRCAVGAGYSPTGYAKATDTGTDSYAEVVASTDTSAQTFTWATELAQLPLCEQSGDTCTWTGSPVATASGIVTMGASETDAAPSTKTPPSKPWFALSVSGQLTGRGRVMLSIHVGIRLFGVRVIARLGTRQRMLHVASISPHSYSASGRLGAGTWTVTIVYQARFRGRQPISRMQLTVP